MSKKIDQTDLNIIVNSLTHFPNGASLEKIVSLLPEIQSKRTLQYRLAFLVTRGQVTTTGQSRSRRYLLVKKPDTVQTILHNTTPSIPLSAEAKSIQEKITKPILTRKYISYNREFLDNYQANSTYYLPLPTRNRLLELGKTRGVCPAGTYAKQIFNRLLIDLSWNSSRLEGNTYSLLETERLLEIGQAAEGKNAKESQMIINHKAAIEFLVELAENIGVNRYTILNLHALLSNNLLSDVSASGSLRSIPVGIAQTVYLPLAIPQLINECFDQIIHTAQSITDPFEQSFFLMVHLPYLQPFINVNKRVSRLAANLPLIKENLCPLSFVDVPENLYINGLLGIYELNRVELLRNVFVWAYERSCLLYSELGKTLGEPDLFRMRYQKFIKQIINNIIYQCMDRDQAVACIKDHARDFIPPEDQPHFIEVVETEILHLHEGNISRYQIHLLPYETWRKHWH